MSKKQKPNRNRDQRCAVRIKVPDDLQYKMGFCIHHSSVVD